MSISERATAGITEMPAKDRPISEEFRLVAKAWCEAHAAAELLEKTRDSVFSQLVQKQDSAMKVNAKEHAVNASQEWQDYLAAMVEARKEANLRRAQMKYVEMKFSEWQASDANQRSERRMSR